MQLPLVLWILYLINDVTATWFVTGQENIPARCQRYNPKHRYRNLTMDAISLDVELLQMAEGKNEMAMIRLGCPKGYRLFSEWQCIPDDPLNQFRAGAMSWNQLLEHRVNKSSLKHLSKDSGRCARYKPHDEPSEEFDDEHCLSLQTICLYKFGFSEFDWVVSRIEAYPNKAKAAGKVGHAAAPLTGVRDCGDKKIRLQFGELVQFDETHCVRKSTMESYLAGQVSWQQVIAAKKAKRLLEAATSLSSQIAAPANAKSEGTILQIVVPLIRSYISGES